MSVSLEEGKTKMEHEMKRIARQPDPQSRATINYKSYQYTNF
jgi:hypothetical protein